MKLDFTTWIFIGGVISLLGAGIVAWASYKSGIESGKQTDEIMNTGTNTNVLVNELTTKNIKLSSDLDSMKQSSADQVIKIGELTNLNAELSIQLSNSTILLSQSITGGDGFCELEFVQISNPSYGKVFVKNHGKYPLHDFKARIIDLEEYDEWQIKNPGIPQKGTDILRQDKKNPEVIIDLGTILSGSRKELPMLMSLGRFGLKSSFNIFYTGKNGSFCQLLRYYNLNGKWVKATRISALMEPEILYEYIDSEFPNDQLVW